MFKEKSSKKRIHIIDSAKETSTLDARHNQMIQSLQTSHQSISSIQKELSHLNDDISRIESQIKQCKLENNIESDSYNEIWDENILLHERRDKLAKTLESLKSQSNEINYYEDTGYILFKYYDIIDKQESNSTNINQPITIPTTHRIQKSRKKVAPVFSKNILDAFNISGKDSQNSNQNQEEIIKDKTVLVDEYLAKIDLNYISPIKSEYSGACPKCNVLLTCLQQEGIMVCSDCGYQEILLVEQNRPLLRQPNKEASHASYKRINHFREWCSQVQGKESTDIPESIFKNILEEIKKEKIRDIKKISYQKMREILKKLHINKYYEHINYIINRINGVPTPHFTPELEEKLCNMFKEIQGPFLRHCPKDRKNFLSYSYVLFKFFELLKLDEHLRFFPLLKSREKLAIQDQIFKCICEDLSWPFMPSL